MIWPIVIRSSRLANKTASSASGSSTSSADSRLVGKPAVCASSMTSNHASQTSSVASTARLTISSWRRRHAAQPVAANASSSATSKPTQAPRQPPARYCGGSVSASRPIQIASTTQHPTIATSAASHFQLLPSPGPDSRSRSTRSLSSCRRCGPLSFRSDSGSNTPDHHMPSVTDSGLVAVPGPPGWQWPGPAYAGRVDRELVFVRAGFGAAALPYDQALQLQRELHERRVRAEIPDTCLLLEHQPVYTAGRRTSPLDRPAGDPGAPVIEVDRGGKITWHGPGQLVGYPIVALDEPIYVISYVRAIEEALIRTCADAGLATGRVDGRSGVWVRGSGAGHSQDRKVGAIGIRVARGVTMHGFALNCDNDLAWFDRIVPCGIPDASVTSLSAELGRPVPVADVLESAELHLTEVLGASHTRQVTSVAELLASPVR